MDHNPHFLTPCAACVEEVEKFGVKLSLGRRWGREADFRFVPLAHYPTLVYWLWIKFFSLEQVHFAHDNNWSLCLLQGCPGRLWSLLHRHSEATWIKFCLSGGFGLDILYRSLPIPIIWFYDVLCSFLNLFTFMVFSSPVHSGKRSDNTVCLGPGRHPTILT